MNCVLDGDAYALKSAFSGLSVLLKVGGYQAVDILKGIYKCIAPGLTEFGQQRQIIICVALESATELGSIKVMPF
jgi:hypothetical protein